MASSCSRKRYIEKIHCGFPHTNIFDLKLESIPLMLIDSNGELLLFIDAKSFNKINLLCVYRINLFCGFAHVSMSASQWNKKVHLASNHFLKGFKLHVYKFYYCRHSLHGCLSHILIYFWTRHTPTLNNDYFLKKKILPFMPSHTFQQLRSI